jgi:hypothetical protein
MHILEWSYARQYGETMIMEMGELWIYQWWMHINLKERRKYNLTMSCGISFIDSINITNGSNPY